MREKKSNYKKIIKKFNPLILQASEKNIIDNISKNNTLVNTVSYVIAPVLFDYTYWILKEAKQRGVERLYFLSRDAYILYQIAQKIIEAKIFNIECKYLYTSRFASRVPAYKLMNDKGLKLIFEPKVRNTYRTILQNITSNPIEQTNLKRLLNLSEMEMERKLSIEELKILRNSFENNKEVMDYLQEISSKSYSRCISYFKQAGLFDSVSMGIVDVGWRGTSQPVIEMLLNKKIPCFYFGLFSNAFLDQSETYYSYIFYPKTEVKFKAFFNNSLFETFCSAPTGMTIDYKEDNNKWKPVFKEEKNINSEKWVLDEQIELILSFVNNFLSYSKEYIPCRKMVKSLLVSFTSNPSVEEAKLYGDYLFSDESNEDTLLNLAPAFTIHDFIQIVFTRYFVKPKRRNYTITYWRYGSINRSNINVIFKEIFWLYTFITAFVRFIKIGREK